MTSSRLTRYKGTISDAGSLYEYQYRTVSVEHFPELQEDMDRLRREGKLSDSETFREYLSHIKFQLPENFADAKFVIILAVFNRPFMTGFRFNGSRVSAAMPSGYYETGLTQKGLREEIQKNIIARDGYRIERASDDFHLKLLAVRSGLGRYGRNNICYVEGMGSFLALHAFLTDHPFEEDHWGEMRMMELCQDCMVCMKQCSLGVIRAGDFVIDVKRCVTLYNEAGGEFPDWLPASAHNAIFGCVKCQFPCPANRRPLKQLGRLEDITQEETRQFVSGNPDEKTILSMSQKLKIPYLVSSKETVEILSRNIKALLQV